MRFSPRLIVYFVFGLLFLAMGYVLAPIFNPVMQSESGLIYADFLQYLTGVRIAILGNATQLYDLGLQHQVQVQLVNEAVGSAPVIAPDDILLFNYPPWLPLILSWMAPLSIHTAYGSWLALNLILLLTMLWALLRPYPLLHQCIGLLFILTFVPVLQCLQLGQAGILLAFALTFYWRWAETHPKRAANAFILGAIKPQLVLLPTIHILLSRQVPLIKRLVRYSFLLIAIVTLYFGPTIWLDWLELLQRMSAFTTQYRIDLTSQPNLRGAAIRFWGMEALFEITVITNAIFVAAIIYTAWLWRRPIASDRLRTLLFSRTAVLGLIFCPWLHPHDLALAIPMVFWQWPPNRGKAYGISLIGMQILYYTLPATAVISGGFAFLVFLLCWNFWLTHQSEETHGLTFDPAR